MPKTTTAKRVMDINNFSAKKLADIDKHRPEYQLTKLSELSCF